MLSQRPGALAIAGAAALFLGLWSLAGAGEHTDRRGAIGFAVVTGCFIAAYSLIDARAVAIVSPAGYLSAVMGIEGIVLTAYLRFDLRRMRNVLGPGIAIGVGTVAAYLLVLFAFQRRMPDRWRLCGRSRSSSGSPSRVTGPDGAPGRARCWW